METKSSSSQAMGDRLNTDVVVTWKRGSDVGFPVREGQCSCSCGDRMFVFGGVVQSEEALKESNELLCFNGKLEKL